MRVSSSKHVDTKELGSSMLTYNKHSEDKHQHQAKRKCEFMRKARAEIFSRGHVGDIRKWMEELQVVFALLRAYDKQNRKSIIYVLYTASLNSADNERERERERERDRDNNHTSTDNSDKQI